MTQTVTQWPRLIDPGNDWPSWLPNYCGLVIIIGQAIARPNPDRQTQWTQTKDPASPDPVWKRTDPDGQTVGNDPGPGQPSWRQLTDGRTQPNDPVLDGRWWPNYWPNDSWLSPLKSDGRTANRTDPMTDQYCWARTGNPAQASWLTQANWPRPLTQLLCIIGDGPRR